MAYDVNKIKTDFFIFDGVITKQQYQRSFIILFVIGLILGVIVNIVPTLMTMMVVRLIFLAIEIVLAVAAFSITIRRLRGMGHSPWLSLLLLVPLVGLLLMIYLLIADKPIIPPSV